MYPPCKRGQGTSTQPAHDTLPKLISLKSFAIVSPCSVNAPCDHQFGGRNATCSTTAGYVPAQAYNLYEYTRQGSGVAVCRTTKQFTASNVQIP